MLQSHRDLAVWQKAMTLVVRVYTLTETFPKAEQFGLTAQIRRAAVSVPANIAEGRGRFYRGDFAHHVSIARGSLTELEVYLEIARRLDYASPEQLAAVEDQAGEVGRMVTVLFRSLRQTPPGPAQ